MTTDRSEIPPAHRKIAKAVGKELRRVREKDRKWTRKELAARLDNPVTDRTLLAYEGGVRQLTLGRFYDLCNGLEVHPAAVLAAATGVVDPRELVKANILVDVPELARNAHPKWPMVHHWATQKMGGKSPTFVELGPAAVRELATLEGRSHLELALYLVGQSETK